MYAGTKPSGQLAPYNGRLGDQRILEQSIIAGRISKAWNTEKKTEINKYSKAMGSLRKVRDDIQTYVENKRYIPIEELRKMESEFQARADCANDMMKALVEDYKQAMQKAGVTTSLGYNFYDLRGPAYLIYPVNTPLRNMLPRWGKVNAGVGTMANWKYTYLSPGTSYAGAMEGQRVAYATPGENNAFAAYKELGVERSVSFTAEFAGEGYTDNVADEHIRGAHELWLQEESIIWGGNPGTGTAGQNGFQLGTANTPTVTALVSNPGGAAGLITDGGTGFTGGTTHVSVRVLELTMLGYPNNAQYGYQAAPTIASGLTPNYLRTNADTTQNTINGGMGQLSLTSNIAGASSSYPWVLAEVTPKKGAFAWAWFIDLTDSSSPNTANAYLTVITKVPFVYIGDGTPGAYPASSVGLNSDNSAETLDFAGIIAWAVNNGSFINMSDLTSLSPITGDTNTGLLTPGLTAQSSTTPACAEIEYDLKNQWDTFQWVADEIWASADAKLSIAATLFANTSGVPAYRFDVTRDAQGNILGGFTVSGYKNQYSMKVTGSEEIPIYIHPQLPAGTIVYRTTKNPYPHSRIPGVAGMFVQRDYYGIEWPITTRAWTFGTYVHEVYGDYIPGLLTVRTGILGANT